MPCFSNGTLITTLKGEKPVEALSAGDRVVTRDNGLQTVRRVSRREYDFGQLALVPHLQPVLVSAGAMGQGLPERDMLVSPNLRLLAAGDRLPFGAGADRGLVAVKNLTDSRLIRTCSVLGVRYVHVMFDRHEVILANGVWAEAFQPADTSLGATGNAQRVELAELIPDFAGQDAGPRNAVAGGAAFDN